MEKFVAIALAPEGLLSNSSLLHTVHSTHRLLACRAPCAATTSPAQAAGKCGHHDYGSKLYLSSIKCECYVVVGDTNVSATTHFGSTKFEVEWNYHVGHSLRRRIFLELVLEIRFRPMNFSYAVQNYTCKHERQSPASNASNIH